MCLVSAHLHTDIIELHVSAWQKSMRRQFFCCVQLVMALCGRSYLQRIQTVIRHKHFLVLCLSLRVLLMMGVLFCCGAGFFIRRRMYPSPLRDEPAFNVSFTRHPVTTPGTAGFRHTDEKQTRRLRCVKTIQQLCCNLAEQPIATLSHQWVSQEMLYAFCFFAGRGKALGGNVSVSSSVLLWSIQLAITKKMEMKNDTQYLVDLSQNVFLSSTSAHENQWTLTESSFKTWDFGRK